MTATATRLIQESFPISPLGGTLGGGMQSVSWRPSKEVWNKTTGETINAPVQAQVDPIKGRAGWKDDSRSGAVGIPLACIDDPNNSSSDWWWLRTPHVQGVPGEELAFYVTLATADIVLVANLVPASSNPIQTGLIDITSADHSATITTPSPGVRDISVVGGGGGGSGTVTSVAQTVPPEFAVAGSPITGAGTLAISKATQAANQVWAGPTTGGAAAPTFRALGAADLPAATTAAQGAAVLATPSSDVTAGHVVQASDARLSDARPPSTPTTKGDLVGFSTVPARVPVGSNGQQLIADSTQALGLRYDSIVKEFSWTATGYGYFQAGTAMTLDQAVTPNGTFAYDKASAGALGTFSSTSLPVVLAAGDVLRVNCSALANSYGALVLKRTA